MSIERDKYLTLQMGMCWHEIMTVTDRFGNNIYVCKKCGSTPLFRIDSFVTPNFSELAWFEHLYTWVSYDTRFAPMFMSDYNPLNKGPISPDDFANLVYMFLKEQEKTECEKETIFDKLKRMWKNEKD